MYRRIYKVYGAFNHRQRESFSPSTRIDLSGSWGKKWITVLNSDFTGTNLFSVLVVHAETYEECERELHAQLSDGIFENCNVGNVEEINSISELMEEIL